MAVWTVFYAWYFHPAKPRRSVGTLDAHPIEKQHTELEESVERTAEALDQRDRAGVCRAGFVAGFSDQMRGQGAVGDAEHPAHDRRAGGVRAALPLTTITVYETVFNRLGIGRDGAGKGQLFSAPDRKRYCQPSTSATVRPYLRAVSCAEVSPRRMLNTKAARRFAIQR